LLLDIIELERVVAKEFHGGHTTLPLFRYQSPPASAGTPASPGIDTALASFTS
jgi:hypothetical protein